MENRDATQRPLKLMAERHCQAIASIYVLRLLRHIQLHMFLNEVIEYASGRSQQRQIRYSNFNRF